MRPNCNNCEFSYFSPDDPKEIERCSVVGNLDSFKVNPDALELLESTDWDILICEYYSPRPDLKNEIEYL